MAVSCESSRQIDVDLIAQRLVLCSGAKRVFDQHRLSAGNTDDVEPDLLVVRLARRKIMGCHPRDLTLFVDADRVDRITVVIMVAAADLDEHQHPRLAGEHRIATFREPRVGAIGDEIELAGATAKVALDDEVAVATQKLRGEILGAETDRESGFHDTHFLRRRPLSLPGAGWEKNYFFSFFSFFFFGFDSA